MEPHEMLLNWRQAFEYIEGIEDPIIRDLVDMACTRVLRTLAFEKRDLPESRFDVHFFARVLSDLFSEQDIIKRALSGEQVGRWFTDDHD